MFTLCKYQRNLLSRHIYGTNKYIFCLHDLIYRIFIKPPRRMFDTSIIIKLQKGDFFCFFACECTANIISVTQIDQTEKVMEFLGLEKLGTTLWYQQIAMLMDRPKDIKISDVWQLMQDKQNMNWEPLTYHCSFIATYVPYTTPQVDISAQ